MIGRIGKDADGKLLFKGLSDCGVYMDGVEFDDQLSSGQAFVHLTGKGRTPLLYTAGQTAIWTGHSWKGMAKFFKMRNIVCFLRKYRWKPYAPQKNIAGKIRRK